MPKSLFIEIEARDDQSVNSLLRHILGEVTSNEELKNKGIECQSKAYGGWIEVLTNNTTGKYRWEKAYGRNYKTAIKKNGDSF